MLKVAEWRITGVCNLRCVYCYGPEHSFAPAPEHVSGILSALVASPIPVVRFSGGEPLLVQGIEEVISKLHDAGKAVILSTNGTRYLSLKDKIEPAIAKLNVSVDGFDPESHALNGRKPDSFSTALGVLESLAERDHTFKVKVGTVLTARNIGVKDLLPKMYDLISSLPVHRWKIYQYVPEGPIVDPSLRVSDELFKFQESVLRSYVGPRPVIDIGFASASSRTGAYFIIQPDGQVIVPVGDSNVTVEETLGNIITDPFEQVASRWERLSHQGNHFKNLSLERVPLHQLSDTDRRILFEVDRDPHIGKVRLAQLAGVPEEEVTRGLDRLFTEGVIRYSMPIVNLDKLGFGVYLFDVSMKPGAPDEDVIQAFKQHPNVGWLVSVTSHDTVMGAIFARSSSSCSEILSDIVSSVGDKVASADISTVYEKFILGQRYLTIDERVTDFVFDNSRVEFSGEEEVDLTEKDRSVMSAVRELRTTSLAEISMPGGLTEVDVEATIADLTRRNIITKFEPVYDVHKLGHRWFHISLRLNWLTKSRRDQLIDYLHGLTRVVHINCMIGAWHLNFEIHALDDTECQRIMSGLEETLPDVISAYEIRELDDEHKFNFLTDAVLEVVD